MKIAINKTKKIIGMGDMTLLPERTEPVPDSLKDSVALQHLVELGHIELKDATEEEAVAAGAHVKSSEELIKEMKAIKKKDDLVALAEKEGIGVEESDTVSTLQAKLEAFYKAL